MYCTNCGLKNTMNSKFCADCGTKMVSPKESFDINIVISNAIDTHLSLLGGYGSSVTDRPLIENAITELFNEIHSTTVGGKCFTFDQDTRACSCDTVDEFADSIAPLVIESILTSEKVPHSILPIISVFLNWFVFAVNVPIGAETKHILFMNNLRDGLSDSNLNYFGVLPSLEYIGYFYSDEFPKAKAEFFEELKKIVDQAVSGKIEAMPSSQSIWKAHQDRKDEWQNVLNWCQNKFYPVKLSVREALASDYFKDTVEYLTLRLEAFLSQAWVGVINCDEPVSGNKSPISGKNKLLFFSEEGICELYSKEKERENKRPMFIPKAEVIEIAVGTENHQSYGGFSSSEQTFMVITIFTTNHQIYTRYKFMGDSEERVNQNRPGVMNELALISQHYSVVEGDVVQSSSGYSITPSIGFWHSID
jgi:hypothetical protein